MSVDVNTGKHIPKNPSLFQFDNEVIAVFNNMAKRSIPGYDLAYQSMEYILQQVKPKKGDEIWDMGTTTGKALKTAQRAFQYNPYLEYYGCDISEDAVKRVKEECPFATVFGHDLSRGFPNIAGNGQARVIVFGWTLQFIEDQAARDKLIKQAYDRLAKGGMLFVMEKYTLETQEINDALQTYYIQWRRDNGYSLEEIDKKTEALKNAMWTKSPDYMECVMRDAGFNDVEVFFRQLHFGGLVAFKR